MCVALAHSSIMEGLHSLGDRACARVLVGAQVALWLAAARDQRFLAGLRSSPEPGDGFSPTRTAHL